MNPASSPLSRIGRTTKVRSPVLPEILGARFGMSSSRPVLRLNEVKSAPLVS